MTTTNTIKARYRNKLKKIIVEVFNGEKWIYVKTLPDPIMLFRQECLDKVSQNKPINEQKQGQKFAYELLNEPVKQDTKCKISDEKDLKKHVPTEEELKMLWDLTKE